MAARGKDTTMRTLLVATAAFAALVMGAPIGKAHAANARFEDCRNIAGFIAGQNYVVSHPELEGVAGKYARALISLVQAMGAGWKSWPTCVACGSTTCSASLTPGCWISRGSGRFA